MFDAAVTNVVAAAGSVRGPGDSPAPEPRWALAVAILGSGMAFLDGTVVNVALPVMQRDLRATAAGVQWIVEAYMLLLAALVLVGGALGDRLGRRRVFLAGVALFAVASAGCGLAPTIGLLIVARGVQGVGAALLVPGSLALISAAYPAERRGAAIGTWSSASAITGAVGPVVGGWVVSHASWRWLFFFNVPVAAAVIVLARRRVAETRDAAAPPKLDLAGAALATVGLGLVVYALVDSGNAGGIASTRTLALLAGGVATLAAFLLAEARQAAPMVPLSLFRSRTFAGANLLTLLLYAALGGAMYFIPFNLIQVQRYSPGAAGASLVPAIVIISVLSRPAGALAARIGPRPLLCTGPLVAGAGFVLLSLPTTGGVYWTTYFPGIVVLGLGMGLTVAPLTTAVMGALDQRHAGVASGINNAVARAAGLLAIAIFGVLLLHRFNQRLDDALSSLPSSAPLAPAAARALDAQRGKMGAADFSGFEPALRAPLRRAFDLSFAAAFRSVMLTSAALAALAAFAGLAFIEPRRDPPAPRR